MKIGFLSLVRPAKSNDLPKFQAAAKRLGVELCFYKPTDFVITIRDRYLEICGPDMKALTLKGFINWVPYLNCEEIELACTLQGLPFINSVEAIRIARNKMLTSLTLTPARIAQPDVIYLHRSLKGKLSHNLPQTPCVFKPKTGTHGNHSYKFTSQQELLRFIRRNRKNRELYLQEYVPNYGWDLRVMVVGGRVLGAIKKTAAPGEWRTHVLHGGHAEIFTVDKELERLALATAACLKLKIAGLDIILDKNREYKVLEANSVPGLAIFEQTTGINVAEEILSYMVELTSCR